MSQNKLISKTYIQIKDSLFSYIKKNADKIEYQRLFSEHADLMQSTDWEPEYKEIIEKLKSNNNKVVIEKMKKDFTEWYTNLPATLDILIENIYNVNGEPKYKEYPILTHIDIQSFYEKIQSLSLDQQRRICAAFTERYGKQYSNGVLNTKYFSDISKVKELSNLYKPDSEDVLMSPVNYRKKILAQWYNELYEWMIAEQDKKEQTGTQ